MRKAVWNDCCRPMKQLVKMVGVRGFEPPAPASRRQFFLTVAPLNLPFTYSDPLGS